MNLWKYYNGDLKYPDLNNHSNEIEIAKTNPKWAFEYVSKHGKDEELERIIAKDAKFSYQYARDVLRRVPFLLGENAIAKNVEESYYYARYILKGKFSKGEFAISKSKDYSKWYTEYVLKKDFYLDDKLICKYEG